MYRFDRIRFSISHEHFIVGVLAEILAPGAVTAIFRHACQHVPLLEALRYEFIGHLLLPWLFGMHGQQALHGRRSPSFPSYPPAVVT